MIKDRENKKNIKSEKDTIEEINLDEIDMDDLDLLPGGCNCAGCPMNCHDDIKEVDSDKKEK
jgi:hypothetical protein